MWYENEENFSLWSTPIWSKGCDIVVQSMWQLANDNAELLSLLPVSCYYV